MINTNYLDEFNSPIRQISGRAEVLSISALSLQGKVVQIDNPAPKEKVKVKVASKNLLDDNTVTCGNMAKNDKGQYWQTVDDTADYFQLKLQAYKDDTLVKLINLQRGTLGVVSITFDKDDTFNKVCFGHNGRAKDLRCWIPLNHLENGTYTFSANITNVTMGSIAWEQMQIEKGSTASEYTPYMPLEGGRGSLYFEGVYYNDIGDTYMGDSGIYTVSEWHWNDSGELTISFEDGYYIYVSTNGLEYETSEDLLADLEIPIGTQLYYDTETDSLYRIAKGLVSSTITVGGKNMLDLKGYKAYSNYGTTIDTTEPTNSVTITQTKYPNPENHQHYNNGFVELHLNSIPSYEEYYAFSCDAEILANPLGATYMATLYSGLGGYYSSLYSPNGSAFEVGKKYRLSGYWTFTDNGKNFIEIRNAGMSLILSNIQLERGKTATEGYEPYKEPTQYIIDETLSLEVDPYIPTTVIYPNDEGIYIEKAECSTLCTKDYFTHDGALKEIVIDKAGENGKFFGFGIGQKATIKLLDKERLLDITKDNYFKIDFRLNENDFINTLPIYFVSETTRDETTNEITITALDYLDKMSIDTVDVLNLKDYTIRDFASKVASYYNLMLDITGVEDMSCFDTYYKEGANFDGSETIRNALNALAEVTQTIYHLSGNKLVFKRLNVNSPTDLTIEKQHYFTLESKDPKTLGTIAHITELGENVTSAPSDGETQYIRDNPFWELREDVGELIDKSISNVSGLTITPFNCAWRGNFLLEPCDKIEIVTKDNASIVAYFINDKITYNGGYSQTTEWQYEKEQETASNPSTLGETLRKTYARVDKVNKQIDLVASESSATKSELAALQVNTNSINASVTKIEKDLSDTKESIDGDIGYLKSQVETQITPEDVSILVKKEISNGVDKIVTSTGYVFDDDGMNVSKSDSDISTTISHNGMQVAQGQEEVLTANKDGVKAQDLHATTFLIIGKNSRFEDYGNRTACFWIGGK